MASRMMVAAGGLVELPASVAFALLIGAFSGLFLPKRYVDFVRLLQFLHPLSAFLGSRLMLLAHSRAGWRRLQEPQRCNAVAGATVERMYRGRTGRMSASVGRPA